MKTTQVSIGTILFIMIISAVILPLGLIVGINFILSAMEIASIPITLGSWFGAWLVLMLVKSELHFSSK